MDNNSITLVISGYHGDLGWVSDLKIGAPQIKNVVLYAKSDNKLTNLSTVDKVVHVENIGINMYDICHYISNNYEQLSGKFLFLKSNSFSRIPPHCNFDNVVKICNELPNIYPLEIEHPTKLPQSTKTINGGFLELNNNWLSRTKISRKYFNEFDEYMNFFFKNYNHQNYLRFPPGGNIFVDSNHILAHPKYLYESLLRTVSHHKYPIEMMYLERGLLYILLGGLRARSKANIDVLPKVNVSNANTMRWRIYSRLLVIAESVRPKTLRNKELD